MSVHPDELTGVEQAVLLVLMAECRPVRNPELKLLGPELKKDYRDNLNRRGLIESKKEGTALVHELTDDGWALCHKLFGAVTPPRPSGQGRALYTVLASLARYFEREDLRPGDVFAPAEVVSVEARVRQAYDELADRRGAWVGLRRLRDALPDVSRADVDAELLRLYQGPGVSLIPEENQKVLTDADRAASIRIGNKDNHVIAIHS